MIWPLATDRQLDCRQDVRNVLARPYDTRDSAAGLDERPVALRRASRPGRPMRSFTLPGCGTSRCCSRRRELWEMAVAMSFVPTAAVGDRCRDVARVDWSGGRSHPVRCPRLPARCRAPVGRYPVVSGRCSTLVRVWEMALGTLPTSSVALPDTCWPLPDRSWYVP